MKEEKKEGKAKKKGGLRFLDCAAIALAVIVLVVSGYKLAGIFLEYKEGEDTYGALADQYVTYIGEVDPAVLQTEPEDGEEGEGDIAVPGDDGEVQHGQWTVDATPPRLEVNFEALREVNSQFIGWLYVPSLGISYPVAQAGDNDYYLHRTFDGKSNSSGAIFMDFGASPDFSDYNTVIYGHNMRNGSMFGKLKRFGQSPGLCARNPYFYIYTEEGTRQYLIISYYVTTEGSDTYILPIDEVAYEQYKSMALRNSSYQSAIEIPDGKMVTLSTCYGAAGGVQRFVVHGVLVEPEDSAEGGETAEPAGTAPDGAAE